MTSTSLAEARLRASSRVGSTASMCGTLAFIILNAELVAGSTSARASVTAVRSATPSRSFLPTVTQAKGRSSSAAHSESSVVFPYPGGAEEHDDRRHLFAQEPGRQFRPWNHLGAKDRRLVAGTDPRLEFLQRRNPCGSARTHQIGRCARPSPTARARAKSTAGRGPAWPPASQPWPRTRYCRGERRRRSQGHEMTGLTWTPTS